MRMMGAVLVGAVLWAGGCDKRAATLNLEPREFLPLDKKDKTVQLKAQTKDDRGVYIATVTPLYESGDPSVATVDEKGLITATGTGKTQVTAVFEGIKTSVPVEVKIIGSVEIEPNTPQKLKMGKSMKVKVTVKDDKGRVLPNEKYTVRTAGYTIDADPDGTITGQATGESTLVVSAKDKEARVKFDVTD